VEGEAYSSGVAQNDGTGACPVAPEDGTGVECVAYLVPERKPPFLSFRPKGEICNPYICIDNSFLATLEMTVLTGFRSDSTVLS